MKTMKATWTERPANEKYSRLECGPVILTVGASDRVRDRRLQHLLITLGEHTDRCHELCVQEWPREAIALARRALDQLESTLD